MMRLVIGVAEEGARIAVVKMMDAWIVVMLMQQVNGVALIAVSKA